ncbi:hypothetical protein CMI37_07760 [Candidatus Pacearchaeota archaeon]|nr:hypothetical protein [Candidatus Pacearchaeota archaeon]|tara:strand:- start:2964 stop:3779 length:816 start_codon:yes stop_codon:yes gene_type:complete
MQIKLLHNLVEELAGVDTGRIVDILFNKKDVNEFLIAKKMELTINQVRNILYKLSADGLVTFIRKKDKRKGWYIYYWTLKTEKCLVKLEQSLISKIADLESLLESRETKRFYVCKACDIEVSEETALENGFTCEECAEVYALQDNAQSIKETKAQILRRERELKLINEELGSLREKEEKKKARQEKKLEEETKKKPKKKVRKKFGGKKKARGKKNGGGHGKVKKKGRKVARKVVKKGGGKGGNKKVGKKPQKKGKKKKPWIRWKKKTSKKK